MTARATGDWLGELDLHLLVQGDHRRIYEKLGAHALPAGDPRAGSAERATAFAVWAPNARAVSIIGDPNGWDRAAHPLRLRPEAGVWEGIVPGFGQGDRYKLAVQQTDGRWAEKADPYAFRAEERPRTASVVWDLDGHEWGDATWMRERAKRQALDAPISVYEAHLGSWARVPEEGNRWLSYREIAPRLAEYVSRLGFTHVELLPVAEHALDESWGYQTIGYFAPTSRHGTPQDFMHLVDTLHQAGIGVILDWVPAHFPKDGHGLGRFDGTALYEHADPRVGEQPDWGTYVFNLGRREVANFLLANALFWLERYHIDGLRVDAVASMLYRDYSRKAGEWLPNEHGGRENLEAIDFLRRFNATVYGAHPDAMTIAEESTSWPMVSRPTYVGGLGFGFKWNMGWMHDTLRFIARDPIYRGHHLNDVSFGLLYAFHENFMLPYSHDEVVHGKGSLVGRMPGDEWQRFANLRALYGFMWGHPGKKLLFMGGEFGQVREWDAAGSLEWHVLEYPVHQGVQRWVTDLNALYRREGALHEVDFEPAGFEWIDCTDAENVVVAFVRHPREGGGRPVVVVCNFAPVPRDGYRLGVPQGGSWELLLDSDAPDYGGSGYPTVGRVEAEREPAHGREHSLALTLPPLSAIVLAPAS